MDLLKRKSLRVFTLFVICATATAADAQPSAEDLYMEGQAAYDRADYATAVLKWQASYDLAKESGLLFNLAQAKRLSGDCAGALVTYRRFIAIDTEPTTVTQRTLAKDLARELESTCPEQKSITAPTKIIPPASSARLTVEERNLASSDRSGRAWKIAGLVTGGAGIVTIAIGLGLGHRGSAIADEVTAACKTSCDWEEQKFKDARGRRYITIGRALDIAGGATVAGGVIFYYLGIRQSSITVAPPQRDQGAVVSWSGSW